MKKRDALKKLDKFISTDIIGNLQDVVIYQDQDGSYQLFNTYRIAKGSDKEFIVTMNHTYTEKVFYTLKNAVTWCTYDKRNKFYESNRIVELDNRLGGLEVDISIHYKLFKTVKDDNDKLIYLAKLNEDRTKKRSFTTELTRYVEESKIWQQKRFNLKP